MNNITESTINKLSNLEVDEIKTIAKSIGIQVSNNEKQEIIDKILFIIQKNKTTIENKMKQDNNNPFNKTSFDKLIIQGGEQGETELLFWKLVKNKSIFKYIMSFMNNKSNSLHYDHLISVDELLDNDKIEILKDKIKRNQYLVFSNPPKKQISMIQTIGKIFEKIKDDKEFYYCLFKYYKYQIIEFNDTGNGNGLNVLGNLLIKSNCLIAFQILVEHYKFIPTIENLLFSFKSNSLQCTEYILPLLDKSLVDQLSETTTSDELDKYIDHFSRSSYLVSNTIANFKIFSEIFKPTKETIKQHWKKLLADKFISQFYSYSSLGNILNAIELYNFFDPNWELYETSTLESIPPLNVSTTDLVDLFFTFKNSNSKNANILLRDINLYLSSERDIIKIILVIYFRIMHSLGNNLDILYVDRFNNHFGDINKSMNLHPFEFAHYPAIENWGIKNSLSNLDHILLFSRCPEKELQIQFLNSLIQDIKNGNPIVSSNTMFTSLLNYDNLELLKHWVNQLTKEFIISEYLNSSSGNNNNTIFKFIKSIEIMDYIFNELYQLIDTGHIKDTKPVIKIQFTNINLFKHFQSLHLNKQKEESIKKKLYIICGGFTVEGIEFVSNNLSVYENYQGLIEYKPIDISVNNQEILFDSLKIAITSNPMINIKELFINREYNTYSGKNSSYNYKKFPSFYYIQFLNWYNIKFNDLINQEPISKSKLNIQYFTYGYSNQLLQSPITPDETTLTPSNIILNYSNDIVRHSINRGDLNTLDLILNTLLNNVSDDKKESISNYILKEIMMEIINSQQLLVLEHILLNHCQLFNAKSSSNSNALFNEDQFLSLFSISVLLENVKITEILLNILPITKNQFEKYVRKSSIIYYHFNDKFK